MTERWDYPTNVDDEHHGMEAMDVMARTDDELRTSGIYWMLKPGRTFVQEWQRAIAHRFMVKER